MDESKDQLTLRCPKLGGPISFEYCRADGDNGLPCYKIADCWWESFDIMSYLKDNLPEDKLNRLLSSKPEPKILSLVELIEKTKKRVQQS